MPPWMNGTLTSSGMRHRNGWRPPGVRGHCPGADRRCKRCNCSGPGDTAPVARKAAWRGCTPTTVLGRTSAAASRRNRRIAACNCSGRGSSPHGSLHFRGVCAASFRIENREDAVQSVWRAERDHGADVSRRPSPRPLSEIRSVGARIGDTTVTSRRHNLSGDRLRRGQSGGDAFRRSGIRSGSHTPWPRRRSPLRTPVPSHDLRQAGSRKMIVRSSSKA